MKYSYILTLVRVSYHAYRTRSIILMTFFLIKVKIASPKIAPDNISNAKLREPKLLLFKIAIGQNCPNTIEHSKILQLIDAA